MTELQGGITKNSPTTELELIKQKRTALQKLIRLTGTITRLHQGLQSVLLMGRSASQIPDKIVSKFKSLSEGLKDRPTDTLQNTLSTTDQRIQRDIKHVLEISQKSNALLEKQLGATGNKLVDILKDDYHDHVNDFKKKSQTSITLRIALKTRNAIVKAFNLPVPESFIQQQVAALHEKENECRKVVKKDMEDLQSDVENLMQLEDCSDDIKQILTEIKTDLQVNADHFNAGKAIDEMPMMYESIELTGAPLVAEQETENAPGEQDKPVTVETEALSTSPEKQKITFFKHLWSWLNSPWKKKWDDIE